MMEGETMSDLRNLFTRRNGGGNSDAAGKRMQQLTMLVRIDEYHVADEDDKSYFVGTRQDGSDEQIKVFLRAINNPGGRRSIRELRDGDADGDGKVEVGRIVQVDRAIPDPNLGSNAVTARWIKTIGPEDIPFVGPVRLRIEEIEGRERPRITVLAGMPETVSSLDEFYERLEEGLTPGGEGMLGVPVVVMRILQDGEVVKHLTLSASFDRSDDGKSYTFSQERTGERVQAVLDRPIFRNTEVTVGQTLEMIFQGNDPAFSVEIEPGQDFSFSTKQKGTWGALGERLQADFLVEEKRFGDSVVVGGPYIQAVGAIRQEEGGAVYVTGLARVFLHEFEHNFHGRLSQQLGAIKVADGPIYLEPAEKAESAEAADATATESPAQSERQTPAPAAQPEKQATREEKKVTGQRPMFGGRRG